MCASASNARLGYPLWRDRTRLGHDHRRHRRIRGRVDPRPNRRRNPPRQSGGCPHGATAEGDEASAAGGSGELGVRRGDVGRDRANLQREPHDNLEAQGAARSVLAGGMLGISPCWPRPTGVSAYDYRGLRKLGREDFFAGPLPSRAGGAGGGQRLAAWNFPSIPRPCRAAVDIDHRGYCATTIQSPWK